MVKYFLLFISCFLCLLVSQASANKTENFSEYYQQDCTFVAGEAADRNDWCNRGNAEGKSPNVVIVGDSYSNSFTTVLEELALQENSKHNLCTIWSWAMPRNIGLWARKMVRRIFANSI